MLISSFLRPSSTKLAQFGRFAFGPGKHGDHGGEFGRNARHPLHFWVHRFWIRVNRHFFNAFKFTMLPNRFTILPDLCTLFFGNLIIF